MCFHVRLCVVVIHAFLVLGSSCTSITSSSCEPIKIPLCQSLGYNETRMPNLAQHSLQSHAKSELETFTPLIQSKCSHELQFFLCSVYAPMCVAGLATNQKIIGPCQPLCTRVREKCIGVLKNVGFNWPSVLSCDKFPEANNHQHMCMEGPGGDNNNGNSNVNQQQRNSLLNALQTNPLFLQKVKEKLSNIGSKIPDAYKDYVNLLEGGENVSPDYPEHTLDESPTCSHLKWPDHFIYVPRYGKCIRKCQIPTKDPNKANEKIMDVFMAIMATISGLSLLISLLLVAMDSSNSFCYPEKTLIFLALCFLGLTPGYLIRAFEPRHEVNCQETDGLLHMAQDGQRNSLCFSSFLFLYFFFVAISSWFVVLSLNLVLSSVLKWQEKQFNRFVSVFHMFGWGIPAFVSILAIITNEVEAEEFTGLCFVGSQNEENLLYFVMLPEGFLSFLSIIFLAIFFVGGFSSNKKEESCGKTKKRIWNEMSYQKKVTFSTAFTVVQILVLLTFALEFSKKEEWTAQSPQLVLMLSYLRFGLVHTNGILCAGVIMSHCKPRLKWLGIFFPMFNKNKDNFPNVGYAKQNTQEMESRNFTPNNLQEMPTTSSVVLAQQHQQQLQQQQQQQNLEQHFHRHQTNSQQVFI